MKNSSIAREVSRRQFLKATGAASAVLGGAGLGVFGYQAGKDPASYTGCESLEGACQTFNRKRFEVDQSPHRRVGPTRRVDARTEVIFNRFGELNRQWNETTGIDGLDENLREYYKRNPADLEIDLHSRSLLPKIVAEEKVHGDELILSQAWSAAMEAVSPPPINRPPEESDFPPRTRPRQRIRQLKMKSPERTSKLIKKISHQLGAVLVGIARLNPDWVYLYPMPGRGFDTDKLLEVPEHWQYAIVVGTPMSWDPMYANPNYGTSFDAYSKSRIVAFRLAHFIKRLGYPARPHTPARDYDLMVPPIMVDAGLGEQGRHSIVVTPELGSNIRPAIVTTNLPLQPDKPIAFGVQDFCKNCKICADNCPSGAITKGEKVEERGYLQYRLDRSKCYNFWNSKLGNRGCRICIAVCPYTRKSNWLHKTALQALVNDPTGLAHKVLAGMQKSFYPAPDPQKYYISSLGGENASYRQPPWWLRTRDFVDL